MIVKNNCGYYELFYTAFNGSGFTGGGSVHQAVGYAVGLTPTGPFWRTTSTPFIPFSSPMYSGTIYIGDSSVTIINQQFIWTGNYYDGTAQSRAVAATMQDACSY